MTINDLKTGQMYKDGENILMMTDVHEVDGWMIAVVLDGPAGRGTRIEYLEGEEDDVHRTREVEPIESIVLP